MDGAPAPSSLLTCPHHGQRLYHYCLVCRRPVCTLCEAGCKNHTLVSAAQLKPSLIPSEELVTLFTENPVVEQALLKAYRSRRERLEASIARTQTLIGNLNIKVKNANIIQSNDSDVLRNVEEFLEQKLSCVMTETAKSVLNSLIEICNEDAITSIKKEASTYESQRIELEHKLEKLQEDVRKTKEKENMVQLLPKLSILQGNWNKSRNEEEMKITNEREEKEDKLTEDEETLIIYSLFGDIIALIPPNPDVTLDTYSIIPSSRQPCHSIADFEAFRGARFLWYVQKALSSPLTSLTSSVSVSQSIELSLGSTGNGQCQLSVGAEGVLGSYVLENGKGVLRLVDLKSGQQATLREDNPDAHGVTSIAFYKGQVFLFTSGLDKVRYTILSRVLEPSEDSLVSLITGKTSASIYDNTPTTQLHSSLSSSSSSSILLSHTSETRTINLVFDNLIDTDVLNWCETSRASEGLVYYAAWGPVRKLNLETHEITELKTSTRAAAVLSTTGISISGIEALYASIESTQTSSGTDSDEELDAAIYTLRTITSDMTDTLVRPLAEAGTLCLPSATSPDNLSSALILDYSQAAVVGSSQSFSLSTFDGFSYSHPISMVRLYRDVFLAVNATDGKIYCLRVAVGE